MITEHNGYNPGKIANWGIVTILSLMAIREMSIFFFRPHYDCNEIETVDFEIIRNSDNYKFQGDSLLHSDVICNITNTLNQDSKQYILFSPDRNHEMLVELSLKLKTSDECKLLIYISPEHKCIVQSIRNGFLWNVFESPVLKDLLFKRIQNSAESAR